MKHTIEVQYVDLVDYSPSYSNNKLHSDPWSSRQDTSKGIASFNYSRECFLSLLSASLYYFIDGLVFRLLYIGGQALRHVDVSLMQSCSFAYWHLFHRCTCRSASVSGSRARWGQIAGTALLRGAIKEWKYTTKSCQLTHSLCLTRITNTSEMKDVNKRR